MMREVASTSLSHREMPSKQVHSFGALKQCHLAKCVDVSVSHCMPLSLLPPEWEV